MDPLFMQSLTEAIRGAIRRAVVDAVREAFVEFQEGQSVRPALLTGPQLCQALQTSPATLHRMRKEGLPVVMLLDSPRYELEAVLAWMKGR